MEENSKTKKFDNLEDMFKAAQILPKFSTLHNHMKKEFNGLVEITKSYEKDTNEYKILVKSCLIELFGLIEADMFYYNSIDRYPQPTGSIPFIEKFKLTFIQIAKTFGKGEIVNEYFRTQMQLLGVLRKKRNKQVHPKMISHLFNPTKTDFNKIVICFNKYDELINNIMRDFFFSVEIKVF